MTDIDKLTLHPALARFITRHVTTRAVADSVIQRMLATGKYDERAFIHWRQEHIDASAALRKLGIDVSSYDYTPNLKEMLP